MIQCQKTRPDPNADPNAGAILTIAGTDPSGGAGIQRDIQTFRDFGLNGLSVITALTAQNQKKVKAVLPVPSAFVLKQIKTLLEEHDIDVIKLGMLARAGIVAGLAQLFTKTKFKKIVIDPIVISSSGYPLLDKKGISVLKKHLLPLTTIVTPNLHEAAILADMEEVSTVEEMKEVAKKIKRLGPLYVLVKGGHLKEVRSQKSGVRRKNEKAIDILYDGREFKIFEAKRIAKDVHGTGCILSSAIAAGLAKGLDMEDAVKKAKIYTTRIISCAS